MKYGLSHPEWLTVEADGRPHFCYDQDWYGDAWQRRSGCGPTTGAAMAAYIERKTAGKAVRTRAEALRKMEDFWPYATPRRGGGLYKTRWLMEGLAAYLADHGLPGRVEMMHVALLRPFRPSAEEAADFIREGLLRDAPLGFLNLHNGGVAGMYSWHWMPLVSLEKNGNAWLAEAADEGKAVPFDLGAWIQRTLFGGGFVRVLDTDR